MKVTTDKDFRPERTRRLIEALQTITSVRNQLPPEASGSILPIVEEILSSLNVKIKAVKQPEGGALEKIAAGIKNAQDLRAEAVDGAAAAGNGVGGSPSSVVVPGGGVIDTPVGPVLASPQ